MEGVAGRMKRLIDRLKRLFERKQYWLLTIMFDGVYASMFSDKNPAVKIAELEGQRIVLMYAVRVSKRDYDRGREILAAKRSQRAREIEEKRKACAELP